MSTDWPETPPYPIPDNGQILETRHLRALALMTIGQAALAAQAGGWGFFLPAGLKPGTVNRLSGDQSSPVIENLAVLTRTGLAIRRQQLSVPVSNVGAGKVKVIWAVPDHAEPNDATPLHIRLVPEGDLTGDDGVCETLGSIVFKDGEVQLKSEVPVLSPGATPDCWSAFTKAAELLKQLAKSIESTTRGSPYVRAATRARLLACAHAIRPDSPMAQVVTAIYEALAGVLAMIEAYAGGAISAPEREKIAGIVTPPEKCDATTLVGWLQGLRVPFDDKKPVMKWLNTRDEELQASESRHISGDWVEHVYAFDNDQTGRLLVFFGVTGERTIPPPPQVQIRDLAGVFVSLALEVTDDGFQAERNTDELGGKLRLRVHGDAKPVVRLLGGGRR